jgi:hypothetical protein
MLSRMTPCSMAKHQKITSRFVIPSKSCVVTPAIPILRSAFPLADKVSAPVGSMSTGGSNLASVLRKSKLPQRSPPPSVRITDRETEVSSEVFDEPDYEFDGWLFVATEIRPAIGGPRFHTHQKAFETTTGGNFVETEIEL